MTTLRELWALRDVTGMLLPDEGYTASLDIINQDLLVGLELEIEEWNPDAERRMRGFEFHKDGSLRGSAVEAVTKPTKSKFIPALLNEFFHKYEITPDNYSERCSVHVHVNCQDLTTEQIKNVCVVYQAVERLLFNWVGETRENNIFCTPWYQSNMSSRFVVRFLDDPAETVRRWQKYTALNIQPLLTQGTIEFRHLEGTCDIARIATWLNFIGSIFQYATSNTYEDIRKQIINMNSVSNYAMFIDEVFGKVAQAIKDIPNYEELLSIGVVDGKLSIADDEKHKAKNYSSAIMDEIAAQAVAPVLARGAQRRYDEWVTGGLVTPEEVDAMFANAPRPVFNWENIRPVGNPLRNEIPPVRPVLINPEA